MERGGRGSDTHGKKLTEGNGKATSICVYSWILKSLLGIWDLGAHTCWMHKRCFETATAFLFTSAPTELLFLLFGQKLAPRFYLASGQTRCFAGKHCQTRQVIMRTNSSFLTHKGVCQPPLCYSRLPGLQRVTCKLNDWLVLLCWLQSWADFSWQQHRAALGILTAGYPEMVTGDILCLNPKASA